jgi:hypothetical protein
MFPPRPSCVCGGEGFMKALLRLFTTADTESTEEYGELLTIAISYNYFVESPTLRRYT